MCRFCCATSTRWEDTKLCTHLSAHCRLSPIVCEPLLTKLVPANEYKQMKMGLERGLREKIPEIVDVVQDLGEGGPELSPETVETVLDTVRPFLNVAGGTIELADLRGVGGMQACFMSALEGLVFGGG